jgi:integrase
MFCFAAHTGARRSEIVRVNLDDVDLGAGHALLTEKKRRRGRTSYRRVPLTSFLAEVLSDWKAIHPGGSTLFAKSYQRVGPYLLHGCDSVISNAEASYFFSKTLAGSKWQVLRGWHTLRHSFCSCCAARAVDQRLIDAWVGHQTEAMARRYRHIFPQVERAALHTVFS